MKKFLKLVFFLVCVIAPILGAGCAADGEETFRSAKILSVSGNATLLRGEKAMEIYEGQVLQGGDKIDVAADGQVELKLDEDKYVVLESGTKVILELEGDPEKGAIRLHQSSGTIHHVIENPLSQGDHYEVHTPDAVMAVRGTDFSTTVSQTETGTQTRTAVREGAVEMTPNDPEAPSQILGPGESAAAGAEEQEKTSCPRCFQQTDSAEAHKLSCAEEHYSCDGEDHSLLPCTHTACAEGDHATLRLCGHYACAEGDHETLLPCGHYTCAEGDHDSTFACQHYICCGGIHDPLKCGHYICAGGEHGKLSCGSYACQSGHRARACGHCVCDDSYESHDRMACGHYVCDPEDVGHYQLSCGYYDCLGNGHGICYGCGDCICTGNHGEYPCGHLVCQGGTHEAMACGHFACEDGSHDLLDCGHYACDGQTHDTYLDCGNLLCAEGHVACVFCGQCVCTGSHGDGVCNPAG